MASGIYGRRVVDNHISDHTLFSQDQYPVTGANRVLTNELESVWDKVNDAKAVLQKLEHRIETTEDAKKAEDLALSLNEANLHKKTPAKNSLRQPPSVLRGSPASKTSGQASISSRSVGHKVAFNEPLVSYHEKFDPLHGSSTAAVSNLASTIQGGSNSFIARDLRNNDFDMSRVTVRGSPTTPNHTNTRSIRNDDFEKLSNGLKGPDDRENGSALKGTVVPTRVLNDRLEGQRVGGNKAVRHGRDIKAAGVATTLTHFDPDQVYKYLQMEGIRKASENANSQSAYPSGAAGSRSPLFLSSPYAPYKRIDVVKQRKKMEQNSEALLRLKEKIQRQKQRSPSIDKSLSQKISSREVDAVLFTQTHNYDGDQEKPRMRKIAHGPAAPKYKGFSTAETRIRTPDGKVWKDGESNHPYIPQRSFQPDKRPKVVSSLFKNSDSTKSKPPLTSGRLRGHLNSSKQNKNKRQKPVRKTGKIRPEDPMHKKSLITPSSWREGQRIAESILGPPPKHPKNVIARDASRPDSPPTRDTDTGGVQHSKKPLSRPATAKLNKQTGGMSQQKRMATSIKASIPTDKLSVEARGVLDDLHLSSSESESDQDEDDKQDDLEQKSRQPRGRSGKPGKHSLPKDPRESKMEKMQKTRHYNQSEVQQYIAKQKVDRKRRQSQERKAHKDAQEKKQKQLEILYRKQKEAASAKKKSMEFEERNQALKQVDNVIIKMDGILDETNEGDDQENESDKENMGQQPLAKFDERMSAFMDKLNQYQTNVPPARTYIPQSKEPEKRPTSSAPPPLSSDTASAFMQKLDRYLKDDTPVTAVNKYPDSPLAERTRPDNNEANLTVEDLGYEGESSMRRPESNPSYRDRYGDPAGTYSPRYRQMLSVDQPSPKEDYLPKQISRVDRIAALKAKAESLQERIQTESKILSEQPIVPIQPRLEEIDAILAKSGHGQSLPIHAWSPESKNDFRDSSRWQRPNDRSYHSGIDVPDTNQTRGGLSDFSPSQLPGVAGLRQHVTDVEKHKTETDAALKIQSSYKGHSVRKAMDEWKLPSGRSLTEVRRQAATLTIDDNSEDKTDDTDNSISEGPLSSRSESYVPDTPIKLRSVEEILNDMKNKEYCVADPPPLNDLPSRKWTDPIDGGMDTKLPEQRTDFLSDFGNRLDSGRYLANDDTHPAPQTDIDKPPWERTGGDKYSVVNVFTNKYLKALKKKEKEQRDDGFGSVAKTRSVSETNLIEKAKSPQHDFLPRNSYSEHFSTSVSKKSPKTKSLEKYSSGFDDTIHDATQSISSVSEDISKSSVSSRSDKLKLSNDFTSPRQKLPATIPSEDLIGKISYSSDDESIEERKESQSQPKPDQSEEYSSHRDENSISIKKSDPMLQTNFTSKPRIFQNTEKKFSPAALEQKMSAELNYQEAIEESLRHLTGVERTQGVSLAQQETVSLAQLMKARQLQHEVEMERLSLKAKEEALETEKKKSAVRMEEEDKRAQENLKMQEASRKALEIQAEAARSSAQAAKQIAYVLKREPTHDRSYSTFSSERSNTKESYSNSISMTTSDRTKEAASGSSSDSYVPSKRDDETRQSSHHKKQAIQKYSPPMSEHSTTSVRLSDTDTQSSIQEQMPSTEEEDKKDFKKLDLGRKNLSDSSNTMTKSIEEDLPLSPNRAAYPDDSDRSISEEIPEQSDKSQVRGKITSGKKKQADSKDQASDESSESSVRFDESLTEDEIADISRRVVVPSEIHRRHQKRRGTASLDRSDMSSDDQPLSARQKTPRGGAAVKGLDDFNIGSSLSGAADSEFVHFMDQMVRQYMLEEEVRSKHQAAMLKLRERAIKEKSETELSWLEQMKKQVRNKGEDDRMPPIKKKQRAILLRLKLETDEIKKLRAFTKVASQERKIFLQQHKENAARRAKLRAAEEKLDIDGETTKTRSRGDELKEPHLTSSTPIPIANISDISESQSELDISSTSSILMKKLKKQIPGAIDQQRLTKREQRLLQRKKQAEQLIAWKKRLDQEEKKVYDIEKKALSAWEKEIGNKSDRNRHTGEKSEKEIKDPRDKNLKSPKTDSSQEASSSGKSPDSDHHSSPPPPSHSESSVAEEILPINTSETNSSASVSAVSPEQAEEAKRSPGESSDGTNADDYSQSFESVTATQHTPRSPKSTDKENKMKKDEKLSNLTTKTSEKKMESCPKDVNSPSSTPLLPPRSKTEALKNAVSSSKVNEKEKTKSGRRESVESWSDESFSQTQSETEQSDIECRVRALKEELKRRRLIAERLKKEQKRRHKDRLKAQEASLRSQIEAYDVFIRKTQNELTQELDHQLTAAASSGNSHLPVSKPQIRSPRKSDQARQKTGAARTTAVVSVSPEASPRSGSHRTPAILGKHRTESESSGKSSRSLSFDDEERGEDATPNGSTKSFPGVVAPLPSKHQDLLPPPLGTASAQHHDSLSSGASTPTEKRLEKPKRLDLTDAASTLSKLTKPLSPNGFTPTTISSAEKQRSLIPIPSKTPPSASKSVSSLSLKPSSPGLATSANSSSSIQQAKKSLIPLPISTSSIDLSVSVNQKSKDKVVTSPPSPLVSEKSIEGYSEDFDSSAASKKTQNEDSITTDDDISEQFSSGSSATATSGDKSDKSGAMLDLASLDKEKEPFVVNKDDTLHGLEDLLDVGDKLEKDEDDDEKTPVISPAQTPIPSSPRTPTPDYRDTDVPPFNVGDKVLLAGRETGVVRFIGETSFAPGVWVGAELQNSTGKNDGSVNNVRYFTCSPKHGIFAPLARVSPLSPKSQSTTSARSTASLHFEYKEEVSQPVQISDEEKSSSESDSSREISDVAKNLDFFTKESDKDVVSEDAEASPTAPKSVKTGLDRNRLADELSDKLLHSLLEDSVTNILDNHADKRLRQVHDQEEQDSKRRKKDDAASSDEEEVLLSASTKQLLEMLASSPEHPESVAVVEDEPDKNEKAKDPESLADTFTGDLLKDTLTKVLEIRRQRAKKWREMGMEEDDFDGGDQDFKMDDGQEIKDILDAKRRLGIDEDVVDDKESTTPVRPVSPIFGTGQEDEWMFDDDIGISSFHKKKPVINKEDNERIIDEDDDDWKDGRLIEVLSGRLEPIPPPPKFVVPHKPEHILRLVEDAVEYYYSKYLRGELLSDVRIPDFLYNDEPDELSEKTDKDVDDQEKKEANLNTNHIYKTSLFDMVRELITDIYNSKSPTDDLSKRPLWLKKKTVSRPSYCRRIPKNRDELLTVVTQQVNKLLNLSEDANKPDPRVTMKWGSRKKKDKVDLILIQELREEEPEWTNYDEDETTVKMQLTDTVLDMLLSDAVRCLDGIEQKQDKRAAQDDKENTDIEERSL